jgi:hypothetical protein
MWGGAGITRTVCLSVAGFPSVLPTGTTAVHILYQTVALLLGQKYSIFEQSKYSQVTPVALSPDFGVSCNRGKSSE